jgi:hypothetical protein
MEHFYNADLYFGFANCKLGYIIKVGMLGSYNVVFAADKLLIVLQIGWPFELSIGVIFSLTR